jgi:hypothetical protein
MTVQGGNAIDHNAALEGMIADQQLRNTTSKLNGSGVVIPYGYGVVTDGDDGAQLPGAGDDLTLFNGIVMRELNRATPDGDTFGAPDGRDMTVMTEGVIWVRANLQVAKDDEVWLIISDGTGTDQGKFSNVVGAAATLAIQIPNAKWVSSTSGAGELAKISLGLGG